MTTTDQPPAEAAPERTFTPRGFEIFADFATRDGGRVTLHESSLATEPCVWLTVGETMAELTAPQAVALRQALSRFIDADLDGEHDEDQALTLHDPNAETYGAFSRSWRLTPGVMVQHDPGLEPAIAEATRTLDVCSKRDGYTLDTPIRYEIDRFPFDPARVMVRATARIVGASDD